MLQSNIVFCYFERLLANVSFKSLSLEDWRYGLFFTGI